MTPAPDREQDRADDGYAWRDPERFREACEASESMVEVAERLGTSYPVVAAWEDKHGIAAPRNRGRERIDIPKERVEAMAKAGVPKFRAAERLGVARNTLFNRLDEWDDIEWDPYRPPYLRERERGVERIVHNGSAAAPKSEAEVATKRLLAAAEFGLDALEGKRVALVSGQPRDVRPDNLALLTPEEEGRYNAMGELPERYEGRWPEEERRPRRPPEAFAP